MPKIYAEGEEEVGGIENKASTDADDSIVMLERRSLCTMRRFKIFLGILAVALALGMAIVLPVVLIEQDSSSTSESPLLGHTWKAIGDLQRPVVADIDGMGESVALSGLGMDLAIGSHKAENSKGRVDVLKYVGSNGWGQFGKVITGLEEGENLGKCVQLNRAGTVLLASGYGSPEVKGLVRAYKFDYTHPDYWVPFGGDVKGEDVGDRFGVSLSMNADGTAFIVGADGTDENNSSFERNGYAVVYELDEGTETWKEKIRFEGDNGSRMGYAVAMSGDGQTVCIGEREYKTTQNKQVGRVTCYEGHNFIERKGVELLGKYAGGSFGYSLSLNDYGNVLAVGDRWAGESKEGSVAVYQWDQGAWHHFTEKISGAGNDQGGFQVALNANGNVLAWTARGHDVESNTDVGVVRVAQLFFNKHHHHWTPLGENIAGDESGDWFGESVALSDTGTVVSASSNRKRGGEYIKTYRLS